MNMKAHSWSDWNSCGGHRRGRDRVNPFFPLKICKVSFLFWLRMFRDDFVFQISGHFFVVAEAFFVDAATAG